MNRLWKRWQSSTLLETHAYTASGRPMSRTDFSGTHGWVYDARDRVRTNTTPVGTLHHSYDANGNLLTLGSGTANGVTNQFLYDALNRLTNVVDLRLTTGNKNTAYGFDGVGNLQWLNYRPNSVTNLYQYDSQNRLTNLVWKQAGTTRASFGYTLNAVGSRTQLTQALGNQPTTFAWSYDALQRLTSEAVSGGSPSGTLSYTFDLVGNRKTRSSALGLGSQNLNYDWNDWLDNNTTTNDASVYFDAKGNTRTNVWDGSARQYGYDWANRLTTFTNGATTATLTYDADGNRTKKVVGATTTWYLVAAVNPTGYPQVVEEHTGASPGTLSRRYTYGLDLISQTVGSTTRFFGTDGLGSTRFLLDTSGTLTEHYGYDAYGTIIVSNAAPSTVYLFAGEQWDPDLGLYYNRARYLNVGLGRFWNYDSFEGSPTDPLSLHKYLYCHANPVSGIDPSGRFEITQTMVTCTIITSLAVITADVAIHKYGGTGYNLTQADLTDPKQPYRAIIIKAARDNRLEPEFVAAIILAELNALWIEDYTTDIPGAIIGDASIGIGQIKPSTVAILRPDFGRGRRVWAAFRPKTAIPLVAEYLRAVADSGVEEPVENFWYSGHQLAMRDFQQDGSTWSWPMEVVMAYNYTQSAWNIRDNPQNGRQEFTERRRAGQYGDWVLQKRRELRGKFN